jgi:glycosyltransferase involved in cell wall biosynthesis
MSIRNKSAEMKYSCPPILPISVIVPAYNAEAFLADAISSVRAQRCVPREIIVIDDGSTDGTCELAKMLGVQLHVQKNRGVSAARNTGVQLATSPWIAFLDADDTWEPDKLALQWAAIEKSSACMMSITGSSYFNEKGELPGGLDAIKEFSSVQLLPLVEGDDELFLCEPLSFARVLAHVNFIVHSSILISREIFLMSGGYDETMRYSEDLDWLLRVATLTSTALVKSPLTRIRTHTTNSSRKWDRMILSHIAVGLKAARYPELYPMGVVDEFEIIRAGSYLEAGLCLLRALDVEGAQKQFSNSWQSRPNFKAALFLSISFFARYPIGMKILKSVRNAAKAREEKYVA